MDNEGGAIRKLCAAAKINWHPLRYHKRPPVLSSAYDLAVLRRTAAGLHRERAFDLVHCRSYIAAAAGLGLKRRSGVPLLFDMRGFWPEEKTEAGNWDLRNPAFRLIYRYFKRLESDLLEESDAIVSLTEAGKAELLKRPELPGEQDRIEVIPCCVDVDHFNLADAETRYAMRQELGIGEEAHVLAYLGSLGGNYLLGEMLDFFRAYRLRYPVARFLFITRDDPHAIRAAAQSSGIDPRELLIRAASRNEVPRLLSAADLGIAFKRASYSATGCSPTKLGEMLAVGLPIVANWGVGDVGPIIAKIGAGVAIRDFTDASYGGAIDRLNAGAGTCAERRERALPLFDVALGTERYDRIYRELLKQ